METQTASVCYYFCLCDLRLTLHQILINKKLIFAFLMWDECKQSKHWMSVSTLVMQSCASSGLNQLKEIKDQILTPNAPVSWNKSSLRVLFYVVWYYVIMKYWLDSQDLCFSMKRETATNIEKVHALISQDSGYIKSILLDHTDCAGQFVWESVVCKWKEFLDVVFWGNLLLRL